MNIAPNQNKKNISFQMRVQFDYQDLNKMCKIVEQLPKKALSEGPYSIAQIARGEEVFTEHACECNIIGFSNEKRSVMPHLIPDKTNLDDMHDLSKLAPLKADLVETLQKDFDELKNEGGKMSAFLIAGMELEDFSSRSISMMEGLLKFLRKNDVEPTIIWGQRKSLNAHHCAKNDTLTIYPNTSDISPKGIKKYFKIMKFNPNDEVRLPNNQPASTGYLTKNDEYVSYTKDLFDEVRNQNIFGLFSSRFFKF